MSLIASQDFSVETDGDINKYDFLILYNEMCQHLKDLQYFPNDQCMLQNRVWLKEPFLHSAKIISVI